MPQNWAGAGKGWQVVEEESYERAVAQYGSYQFFDDALAPIDYALHRNPSGFLEVDGWPDIYLAKTKIRIFGAEVIPSFRLWFKIDYEQRRVHKLWVEYSPAEDMGYWDDDDIPF